jgi:hypothetical protein
MLLCLGGCAGARSGPSSITRASVSKKNRRASEQARPDVARRRARWKMHQGRFDPTRLVFIDETWAKTNMTRRHGRCLRGRRLIARAPHGRQRMLTFLAALRHDRIDAPCGDGDNPGAGRFRVAQCCADLFTLLKPTFPR